MCKNYGLQIETKNLKRLLTRRFKVAFTAARKNNEYNI